MNGPAKPGSTSRLSFVDHNETYGRHILERLLPGLDISLCVDLGCGQCQDLMIVKRAHPAASCVGIDLGGRDDGAPSAHGIEYLGLDIESESLPFEASSVDLVIANQVLEHTKEVFWINHEVFRVLRVGGHLLLGVPNVLALHNRVLGIFGMHPTCAKMISAHVRVFSKRDVALFYKKVAPGATAIEGFYGSQFYPLPRALSRPLARAFPSLAVSIFFLIRKTGEYQGEFVRWLAESPLETSFFSGPAEADSRA